jgi:ribose transport system permease protein
VIIGLITGGLIVALRIHALIVTLGMAAILQGLALLYTLTPVGGIPDGYDFFGYGRVLGVPVGMALPSCYSPLSVSFSPIRDSDGRSTPLAAIHAPPLWRDCRPHA